MTRLLCFSPDSRTLILGDEDARVGPGIKEVAESPDGLATFVVYSRAVAFSPDGSLLALYLPRSGTVNIRDRATGRTIAEFPCESISAKCLAFSPDGRELAAGYNTGEVIFWNLKTRAERLRIQVSDRFLTGLAFARPGEIITTACCHSPELALWNATDGRRLYAVSGKNWGVFELDVAPDRRFAALGCADGTGRLFDLEDRQLSIVFSGPAGPRRGLAFAPDGRSLAIAGPDDEIRRCDIGTSRATRPARP